MRIYTTELKAHQQLLRLPNKYKVLDLSTFDGVTATLAIVYDDKEKWAFTDSIVDCYRNNQEIEGKVKNFLGSCIIDNRARYFFHMIA